MKVMVNIVYFSNKQKVLNQLIKEYNNYPAILMYLYIQIKKFLSLNKIFTKMDQFCKNITCFKIFNIS